MSCVLGSFNDCLIIGLKGLNIYTITKNPLDRPTRGLMAFPVLYGIRRSILVDDGLCDISTIWRPTLFAARMAIPIGLTMMPRDAFDDAVIVECWL